MMVTPRGMLNDANPLMPYRSDKLAICGQRVSNTDPEVPTRLLHYRGYECVWLFSLAFFLAAVSESVWDFISWFDVSCYVHQEELPHYHNLHQN